jgi:type I restriction enzyme R subunit
LIKLIEFQRRRPVYTDFEDRMGVAEEISTGPLPPITDTGRFRAKVRHFLKVHEDHIAIQKLRRNEPLTPTDLDELERIFAEAGIGTEVDIARIRADGGLGLFIRSLVGLDHAAAKRAFDAFLLGRTLTANQLELINMIVEHLTERGVMDPRLLYESPFTDLDPMGAEGVFTQAEVVQLVDILDDVRRRAAA